MDEWFHPIFSWACGYLSMLGFKLNYISKRGPVGSTIIYFVFYGKHFSELSMNMAIMANVWPW